MSLQAVMMGVALWAVGLNSGCSHPKSAAAPPPQAANPQQGGTVTAADTAEAKTSLQHKRSGPDPALQATVTQGDLAEATFKLQSAMAHVLKLPEPKAKQSFPSPEQPASREMVVKEIWRLYTYAEPKFTLEPRPEPYEAQYIRLSDAESVHDAKTLLAGGFLAEVGPVVSGPGKTLTCGALGDALGFFLLRVAECTHLPSIEWSPYLQKG